MIAHQSVAFDLGREMPARALDHIVEAVRGETGASKSTSIAVRYVFISGCASSYRSPFASMPRGQPKSGLGLVFTQQRRRALRHGL